MKIIAIKIGTSVLLTQRNKLDEFRIAHIADQIQVLKQKNIQAILVVSGAVALGANYFDFSSGDKEARRASAGIGQAYLISIFQQIFSHKHLTIAQILLTKDFLDLVDQKKEMRQLLRRYLQKDIIPVINENDVIDLNSFNGNDLLVADIALLLGVKQVLILSTMGKSIYGVGGGKTKQQALAMLKKNQFPVSIVDGKVKNIILESIR